ncbi:MAG: dihydrofolate reductase family protein [Aggregatilineales bacterium]
MGKVGTGFSMSLDGFIAGPNEDFQHLFAWMSKGDTDLKMSTGDHEIPLKVSSQSAEMLKDTTRTAGALVAGRRLFNVTGAWGGKHPLDVPVFVVTHTVPQEWVKAGSPFTFVTDGVESAIEKAKKTAGDKTVLVASASIAQQCIKLGLLDEIHIDLVPVLLGDGIPLFAHLGIPPIELESTSVIEAPGVIHLDFRVVK